MIELWILDSCLHGVIFCVLMLGVIAFIIAKDDGGKYGY